MSIIVLLITVFAGVLILEQSQESTSIVDSLNILPIALLFNLLGMVTGYLVAWFIKLSNRNRFTIAIEVGLQNTALAIFIATTILNNSSIAIVAVLYSSFSFFSTALFGYLMKKIGRNAKEEMGKYMVDSQLGGALYLKEFQHVIEGS